jgi:hypothetical protein
VELERPLTMRAKEGRTAGPEIGSEASGAVADRYLGGRVLREGTRSRRHGLREGDGERRWLLRKEPEVFRKWRRSTTVLVGASL